MPEIVANARRLSRPAALLGILPAQFARFETFLRLLHPTNIKTGERPMTKAFWGGKLIAESDACVVVEGNQYFPADAVNKAVLKSSSHTSICPWKGTAHYYHLT